MRLLVMPVAVAMFLGVGVPGFAAVHVPSGTKVEMRLVHPLSSGTASAGQTFMAEAADSVNVAGRTAIAKGAAGQGTVLRASKAQGKSAGTLTIAFTKVRAVDGSWVRLSDSASRSHGSAEKGKASTATIASTIVLGPIGLFAHNMVKGKDITLTPTQTFPAWAQ